MSPTFPLGLRLPNRYWVRRVAGIVQPPVGCCIGVRKHLGSDFRCIFAEEKHICQRIITAGVQHRIDRSAGGVSGARTGARRPGPIPLLLYQLALRETHFEDSHGG